MYYEMIERQYYCVESLKPSTKIPSCVVAVSAWSELQSTLVLCWKSTAPFPTSYWPPPLPQARFLFHPTWPHVLLDFNNGRRHRHAGSSSVRHRGCGQEGQLVNLCFFLQPSQDSLHCWLELKDFLSMPIFCCAKVAFNQKLNWTYLRAAVKMA